MSRVDIDQLLSSLAALGERQRKRLELLGQEMV